MPENKPSRLLIDCEGETGFAKCQDDIYPPKKPVSASTTITSTAAPSSTECEKVPEEALNQLVSAAPSLNKEEG